VEVNGVPAVLGTVAADGSQIAVTVPALTGQFSTVACSDSGGNPGKMQVPQAVDVKVTSLATGCNDTFPMGYTYLPADTSCMVTPQAPTADFSYQVSGLQVTFTAIATGSGNTYAWSFGDGGSASTTSKTIVHDYSASVPSGESATFSVMLTVKNSVGSAMAVKSVTVTAPP
jgi:PKD repeat protein